MEKGDTFSKVLTSLCIISTIITSGVIICTLITTYQFKNLGQIFNSYWFMQLSGCITMILWGLRFLFYQKGKERYYYSFISFIIALGLIFFLTKL